MPRYILGLALTLLTWSALAELPRALQWQGEPLVITLMPAQETILRFGDDVRVATPSYLSPMLSVTSLAGQVYLTPRVPFENARLHVERLSDGTRLLLDVSAKEGIKAQPRIDIVLPQSSTSNSEPEMDVSQAHLSALKMAPEALLTRYAMQSLYSPSYAIEPLPGVTRAPMGLPSDIAPSAFAKWRVIASPIAAWQLGDKVVTAVKLTNLSAKREPLDPRFVTLSGSCLVNACQVSFSHAQLGPADSSTQSATAFIVTPGPLASHLIPGGRHD